MSWQRRTFTVQLVRSEPSANERTGEKENRIKGLIFVLSPQGQFYGLKLRGIGVQDKLEQKRKLERSPRLLFPATVHHLGQNPRASPPPSQKSNSDCMCFCENKVEGACEESLYDGSPRQKKFHSEQAVHV